MSEPTNAINTALQEAEKTQKDLYLTFHLGNEDYGIEIFHVTEIVGIQKITKVPDMPEFIKGVINLRGSLIPVMDVRLKFRMPERQYDDRTCLVVVRVNEITTALVVDSVNEVSEIPADQIEPSPCTGGFSSNYINGMGKVGDTVKILLNMNALLSESHEEDEAVLV
ncbi:MAG: chemotaxis protein CheW [Deltaproteobacteria bacterium]|jgi:purine-binding chemotaxis protein CheW|nr:chemotaxis protein CheW [Deltaproteobacteria bacterium]MCW8891733.1 chemotaxis protein CheW [Deltaproteobacteria bacterium]MCW9050221.1 chemotaxis protein CheW [Deltaproteobacteria bacterium]